MRRLVRKFGIFLLAFQLTGSMLPGTDGSIWYTRRAEAGILKKVIYAGVARSLLRMASKGITESVKRKIQIRLARYAHDKALLSGIEKEVGKIGEAEKAPFADDVVAIIRNFSQNVAPKYADRSVGSVIRNEGKFWNREAEFGKRKVYQRDDLIDPDVTDGSGMSNLQRMQKGRAPLGPDGQPMELHHMTQSDADSIAEVTNSFHTKNRSVIHPNANSQIPSGISRSEFDSWKADYWKNRAMDFVE